MTATFFVEDKINNWPRHVSLRKGIPLCPHSCAPLQAETGEIKHALSWKRQHTQ
jgi:hypothetical protein